MTKKLCGLKFIVTIGSITVVALGSLSYAVADEFSLIQKDRKFSERKLTISRGDTINFVNNDNVSHNVYSKSDANSFDIGVQRPEETHSIKFDIAGKTKIRCAIHPKMKLTVIVE